MSNRWKGWGKRGDRKDEGVGGREMKGQEKINYILCLEDPLIIQSKGRQGQANRTYMAGNAGHVSQVIYVKKKYTTYDSVHYDTDNKHNIKYYKKFSFFKIILLRISSISI